MIMVKQEGNGTPCEPRSAMTAASKKETLVDDRQEKSVRAG
jgi:hypothetical protein